MASTSAVELIMDSLKTKLWASGFYSAVGGRIAVERLAADAPMPCCVYSLRQFDIQRYMGNQERYEAVIEFTIFDACKTGTDTLHSLADSLRSAVTTGNYTITGLDRITMTRLSGGAPSFDDEAWSITERYRLVSFKVT